MTNKQSTFKDGLHYYFDGASLRLHNFFEWLNSEQKSPLKEIIFKSFKVGLVVGAFSFVYSAFFAKNSKLKEKTKITKADAENPESFITEETEVYNDSNTLEDVSKGSLIALAGLCLFNIVGDQGM
jgi:hypothetical protein